MNMMTEIIGRPTPPIALLRALPPGPLAKEHARLKKLADLFAAFDRDDMEAGVELLLAEMDARDGDPDLDTNNAEDEALTHCAALAPDGPGCPVADPDCGVCDGMNSATGDYTYAEWHTLSASRRRSGEIDGKPLDPWRGWLHEDVEDDNPHEDDDEDNCITDGPHDEEPCGESDASWPERLEQPDNMMGGVAVPEEDAELDEAPARRRYRDRTRRAHGYKRHPMGGWYRSGSSGLPLKQA